MSMWQPSSIEFPFDFLHCEIVEKFHAREKEEELNESNEDVYSSLTRINAITKLEALGFRVGYGLIERLTKEFPRFTSELECMKFICKEFWQSIYQKQVDNLKTNHQGVYVILDSHFNLLTPMAQGVQFKDKSARYLAFSCGLTRGALANLGYNATVTAEVANMPAVKFSVHVQQKN